MNNQRNGFGLLIGIVLSALIVVGGVFFIYLETQNWKSARQKAADAEKKAAEIKVNRAQNIPTPSVGNASIIDTSDTSKIAAIPAIVKSLCANQKMTPFITADGYRADFRKAAAGVYRCNSGDIWQANEVRSLPESSSFYFDNSGTFIDICQPFFRASGCKKFEKLYCETKNYCDF